MTWSSSWSVNFVQYQKSKKYFLILKTIENSNLAKFENFWHLKNGKSYSFLDTLYIWELYYVSNYDENMNLMTWDPFRNLAFTILSPTVWKHFNFFVKSNFSARRFKFHVKSISASLESQNVLFWQLQPL